jgi:hypothetical protein
MSTYPSVVISPATKTSPVVTRVSAATRAFLSWAMKGVQNGVGDPVRQLVGVPFRDRFRRDQPQLAHLLRDLPPWGNPR